MTGRQTVPLGSVAYINPNLGTVGFDADELVDFVPMAAVEADASITASLEARPYEEVKKGYTYFADGDILLAKITPCFENGKISQIRIRSAAGFGSTEFHVIRPQSDKLDARYLVHLLRQEKIRTEGERRMTGSAGQRRVPKSFLESLPVFLPPLAEQRRIAAILDKADALRTKRREALAQLDRLAQSIFVEMFGDQNAHEQKLLQDLCELITDGTHQTPTYADEGVIFLSAKNVTSGEIDWERIKYIPQSLHLELHRRLAPRVGDILLAKNGTTGVAAVVDRDCIFDIYVSLALLRPRPDVLPKYLLAAINSPASKKQFNNSLKGIGVPNLHLKEIRQVLVPSPSQDEQRKFVSRMDALADLRRKAGDALVETESLFAALQHRAFRGEL